MDHLDVVEDFVSLFRGRGDAYGSWEGGCVRSPVSPQTFLDHLNGELLFGVYPLVPFEGEHGCVWGCSDIDVDDLDAARNLQTAFFLKSITAHIEKTIKGYHVWVFASDLVPAATMRRAFLSAHQAIDYVAKEVNPKQENPGVGFGNYVRLPYPSELKSPSEIRYMLDDNDKPMSLTSWLPLAIQSRTSRARLEEVANMYVQVQYVTPVLDVVTESVKKIIKKASAISFIIWRDGPYPGADRSSALYKLAHRLHDDGLTASEAVAILKNADERWGKYHLRADGEEELMKMITHAYGATT